MYNAGVLDDKDNEDAVSLFVVPFLGEVKVTERSTFLRGSEQFWSDFNEKGRGWCMSFLTRSGFGGFGVWCGAICAGRIPCGLLPSSLSSFAISCTRCLV